MNAPYSPSPDPDELASALVDGLLTMEEADRARQDPAVVRHVEEIERVRGQLRATPPPPPGHVDRAVGAALAELDPRVRPLRPLERPARRPGAAVGWLAAAAAILVVALVAAAGLTSSDQGNDDEAATATADESLDAADDGGSGAAEESEEGSATAEAPTSAEDRDAPPDASAPFVAADLVDLGTAATAEDLTAAVTAARENPSSSGGEAADGDTATSLLPEAPASCLGTSLVGDAARGVVTFVGRAVYQGADVVVHIYRTTTGSEQIVATDADCVDVVDQPYRS